MKKEPYVKHKIISWGNLQLMEDLFELFGGDRNEIMKKHGIPGHHFRFKFVIDKLDRESKKQTQYFQKAISSILELSTDQQGVLP